MAPKRTARLPHARKIDRLPSAAADRREDVEEQPSRRCRAERCPANGNAKNDGGPVVLARCRFILNQDCMDIIAEFACDSIAVVCALRRTCRAGRAAASALFRQLLRFSANFVAPREDMVDVIDEPRDPQCGLVLDWNNPTRRLYRYVDGNRPGSVAQQSSVSIAALVNIGEELVEIVNRGTRGEDYDYRVVGASIMSCRELRKAELHYWPINGYNGHDYLSWKA